VSFYIRFHKAVRERVLGKFGRDLTHLKAEGNKKSQETPASMLRVVLDQNSFKIQAANNALDGSVSVIGRFVK
jgi:hypothetical protein